MKHRAETRDEAIAQVEVEGKLEALRKGFDDLADSNDPEVAVERAKEYIAALEAYAGITREPPKPDVTNKYLLATVGIEGELQFLNHSILGRIPRSDAPVIAAWLVAMSCGPDEFEPILDAVLAT